MRLLAVCLAGAVLAGCATRGGGAGADGSYYRPYAQSPASGAAGYGHRSEWAASQIELEDDGLPAQTPPRLMRKRGPDDPTEPFSPNYGRAPAIKQATAADAVGSTLSYEETSYDKVTDGWRTDVHPAYQRAVR